MSDTSKSGVFYECPKKCLDTWFYRTVTIQSNEQLSEDGEHMEYDHFNFTPTGPVCCRKCDTEAVVKTKRVRTIVTIE